MASRSSNLLLPLLVIFTVLIVAAIGWFLSRDEGFKYGSVGPELSDDPMPEEAEADSTSNTIDAMRGQMEIVEQTVNERVNDTLEASEALQEELKQLSDERAAEQETLKSRTEAELEQQRLRNDELGSKIEELTDALLDRLQEVETQVQDRAGEAIEIAIGEGEEEHKYRSGQRIPATDMTDIVWLVSLDESANRQQASGGDQGVGEAVVNGANRLRTGSGLLSETNDAANATGAGESSAGVAANARTNPNVRADLVDEERRTRQLAEDERRRAIVDPAPETEMVYTLPDLSIGFDSSALTALVGRVYVDESEITNPFEFKLVLGRDNVAANGQELPSEIEGMFFEGFATGDRLLSCVRGVITTASFLFRDGTVVPAYVGDPGSRPDNDVYPSGRIGYITDPRGNCIPGQFVSDAPKWLAANAVLAGAQGYAQALRQQEIETASIIDGSNVTVVENFTGEAGRFAGASALVGGIDVVNEYAQDRLDEIFEAVYVPPGHPVVVHLQQEIRIDRVPDARKVTYPNNSGQANAYLD